MSRENPKPSAGNKHSYPPCPLCGSPLSIRTSERLTDSLQQRRLRCRASGCDFRCTSLEEFETVLNDPDSVPRFAHTPAHYYCAVTAPEEY
ncbi:ogr/Delta-like zinc finger family protein [Morganella morganii]|nr:ogr/Delta-like zinc finger family protein [Morganella morganii]HAS8350038.1 hypothetical protein [Vibrio vulnificus]